jgi:hypothetical protein
VRPFRAVAVTGLAFAAVALTASPAAAHDLGGRQPTDIRSEVEAMRPSTPGVTARVVELSGRMELHNESSADVVVLGYDGEPYLRVGPSGTFENARSPAVFLNRTNEPDVAVPDRYDADAGPEWRRVSDETRVRWHDHRAHASRGALAQRPITWEIDLTVDGQPAVIAGRSVLIEPDPWWVWAVLSACVAAAIVVAAHVRWRRTMLVALAALAAGGAVQLAGSWSSTADTFVGRAGAAALPAAALAVAVVAILQVVRRRDSAAAWVLVAAVAMFVTLGVSDILFWFRSQLPSSLDWNAVRAIVALEIGGAAGIGVAAASRLRLAPEADEQRAETTHRIDSDVAGRASGAPERL